jgi:hypothetical protein
VRIADRGDGAVLRGDAELALAELLLRAGNAEPATAAARRAVDHYTGKGHLVGAARAAELAGLTSTPDPRERDPA